MKIFIAGVMQGNRKDSGIYSQDYRTKIKEKLSSFVEDVEFVDPDVTDPDRLTYSETQAKEMFIKYCQAAGKVDLLIAYIPEASMGSAIEMWMAYQNRVPIVTISTMKSNWVVKLLSKIIYTNIDEFQTNFDLSELNGLLSTK